MDKPSEAFVLGMDIKSENRWPHVRTVSDLVRILGKLPEDLPLFCNESGGALLEVIVANDNPHLEIMGEWQRDDGPGVCITEY